MKNKFIKKVLAFPVSLCMIFPNVLGVYAVDNEMPENYPVSVQSNETSKHTYTVRYHLDGSDKVKEVTKTVAAESYSSTLYSRPFQVEDTKTRLEQGYKWIGWSTKENATEAEYTLGQKVTMTAENPELDLYSVYAPLDQAEFNVVVMYKDGETTTLSKATKASVTCKNWSISHPESGSMHESTVKEVYEAATKAASIKSGYKLKGS